MDLFWFWTVGRTKETQISIYKLQFGKLGWMCNYLFTIFFHVMDENDWKMSSENRQQFNQKIITSFCLYSEAAFSFWAIKTLKYLFKNVPFLLFINSLIHLLLFFLEKQINQILKKTIHSVFLVEFSVYLCNIWRHTIYLFSHYDFYCMSGGSVEQVMLNDSSVVSTLLTPSRHSFHLNPVDSLYITANPLFTCVKYFHTHSTPSSYL